MRVRFMRPDWRRYVVPGSDLARYYESIERKYSEDQPRVPAGSPEGGQWTSDNGTSELGGWLSAGATPPGLLAICDKQYRDDTRLCNLVQSPVCHGVAALRYGNCMRGMIDFPDLRW